MCVCVYYVCTGVNVYTLCVFTMQNLRIYTLCMYNRMHHACSTCSCVTAQWGWCTHTCVQAAFVCMSKSACVYQPLCRASVAVHAQ